MSFNLTCKELPNLPQITEYDTRMILSMNNEGIYDGGWVGVCRRLMFYYQKQRQEGNDHVWNQHIQDLHDAWDKAAEGTYTMHFDHN